MHVKGLSIDPSRFSALPLGLLASWWEPQIWKGLYSDPSPILQIHDWKLVYFSVEEGLVQMVHFHEL
jgi:hypothetical protein